MKDLLVGCDHRSELQTCHRRRLEEVTTWEVRGHAATEKNQFEMEQEGDKHYSDM